MVVNILALLLIASGIMLLIISFWAWQLRVTPGARPFALLILSCAVYSLGYAFEISSTSLEGILFWLKVEYLGVSVLPAFLILFALGYSGRKHRLPPLMLAALFVIPLATLILLYTNETHHLYYQAVQINTEGPFPVIAFERGPWFWVHTAYVGFAVLFSNALFILMWLNSAAVYRGQIGIVLAGSLILWGVSLFYLTGQTPWNLDLNPFAFSLIGFLFFRGSYRHRLFDLLPVARTALFEELPDGVLVLNGDLRIVDMNSAARQYLQTSTSEIGQPATEVLETWPDLARLIGSTAHKYHVQLQSDIQNVPCWFRIEFTPLQNTNGTAPGQMILLRDITELKQAEETLHILATTDEVTGLWNRRYFIQAATQEMERAQRYNQSFSLIMFDIDHFKEVNDTQGHAAGDATLQHLASIIKECLRQVDVPGRLGGEEFGVLLPGTDLDDAVLVAERLRRYIEDSPAHYCGKDIDITVSIGVTAYRRGISSVDELLRSADKALYKAKANGRNCTVEIA